jgi:hypothetical protein
MAPYDSDMDAGGLCWFAFEFDSIEYVADMEVWNYNAYPGDCLPEGTQSPCQWTTKPGYSIKDWKISYSRDKNIWKETIGGTAAKGTALTQGPQEGWNHSDDAQYPDTIAIDANAKYVVLTAVNSYQGGIRVGLGEARFETDPNRATNPHKNGGDKFMNMPLSWTPGFDGTIAKHKVYVSTSEAAVIARTAPNAVVTSPTYDPTLSHGWPTGVTYYWAVDELNASNVVVGEGTGRTWWFRNISLGLVDDYESYDTHSNYIWNTWVDGYISNGNYSNGAFVDIAYYNLGQQGLELAYDNDGKWSHGGGTNPASIPVFYSEVRAETDDLISNSGDLTNGGVTTSIRTWVMGPNTNDANEQVYIKIEDNDGNTAQVQYLPATDMDDDTFHEWRIALSDFTGVDVTDVNAISFIVGDGIDPCSPDPNGAPGSGAVGTGKIYFDDFRLQPPECGIMGETDPTLAQGDLNDDCVVDWKDLAILVNNWLDAGNSP